MKKRIVAILVVLALCASLAVNVFARSAHDKGFTIGGDSGNLSCTGDLYVYADYGTAMTDCERPSAVTMATSIIYYYINSSGQLQASSGSGTTSAMAGGYMSNGTRATSQHSVNGGSLYGSWSCSLSASVG